MLLPTPSAIVNNRTSESPGVRENALAELRIISSPSENATVLRIDSGSIYAVPEPYLLSEFSFLLAVWRPIGTLS